MGRWLPPLLQRDWLLTVAVTAQMALVLASWQAASSQQPASSMPESQNQQEAASRQEAPARTAASCRQAPSQQAGAPSFQEHAATACQAEDRSQVATVVAAWAAPL